MAKQKQDPAAVDPAKITTSSPPPSISQPVVSDPRKSYVASDVQYAYWVTDRALPQTIDEAERQFGLDIYRRMAREPRLQGVVRTLKTQALSEGFDLAPSHAKVAQKIRQGTATAEEQADLKKSLEIHGYVEAVLNRYGKGQLKRVIKNLLDAGHLGHKLAEVTYDLFPSGPYAGKMCFEKDGIRPKPRENYTMVLGPNNEFRGILAKVPGVSLLLWQGIIANPALFSNAIDPDKLLILTLDSEDGNPQGVSWFQGCYEPYSRKKLYKAQEVQAGIQQSGGKLAITEPEIKPGVPVKDPRTGEEVNLQDRLLDTGEKMTSGGVGVFPFGTTVDALAPQIATDFFDKAFDRCDREMVSAFLLTARTLLEARHGSKADSDSAQDILDELVMLVRGDVCDLFYDLFKRLVRMSYDEETAEKYTPEPTMQRASRPDFAANATAVAALMTSGYLDPSQYTGIDEEILGLDARPMQLSATEPVQEDPAAEPNQQRQQKQEGPIGATAPAKFRGAQFAGAAPTGGTGQAANRRGLSGGHAQDRGKARAAQRGSSRWEAFRR